MNCIRKFLPIFAAAFAAFVGCSDNAKVANGTGSEAGETEVVAITFTKPNGEPLSRGIARFWTMHDDGMTIVEAGTLNEDGAIGVEKIDERVFLVEASLGDSLSAMRWIPAKNVKTQVVKTGMTATLRGSIASRGRFVQGASVRVLDKLTHTDENGVFVIENVPEGVHYAFVDGDFGKFAYQLQTGSVETPATNNIDIGDSVFTVIEDFENWESRRTLIGKSFGQGWWFICTDSLQGGGSRVSGGLDDDRILVVGDSAKDGHSLHLIFDIDVETEGHYGVAGFAIGDDFDEKDMPSFYDLRATKAISFDARGSGRIYLQITKRGPEGEREYHETASLELSEDWQHFTITADDFGTELVAVNTLNFMVNRDCELFLDNIRLDGISPSTWPSLGMEF